MKEMAVTESDLRAINRYTLKELAEDQVFSFSAKFIDSEPTSNGRVWTREWMEQAIDRKLFDGVPFLTNHENDQSLKIGTVFHAKLKEDGIHGKVFVPLDEQGKQSQQAVENGRIRSVSINATGEAREIDGHTHILPSDEARVFEVSSVAVGGCRTCHITEKQETPCSEASESANEVPPTSHDPIREFGMSELSDLRNQFIRLAGFTLGTSKDISAKVAESVDPMTLKCFAEDLRRTYDSRAKQETDCAESSANETDEILAALKNIQAIKGV